VQTLYVLVSAGGLQTRVAERAENHFNGIVASSSGKRDLRARQMCLMDFLRWTVAAASSMVVAE
jgi:hypothetical protein